MLIFISSIVGFRAVWWILAIKRKWSLQMCAWQGKGDREAMVGAVTQIFSVGIKEKSLGAHSGCGWWCFRGSNPRQKGGQNFAALLQHLQRLEAGLPERICQGTSLPQDSPPGEPGKRSRSSCRAQAAAFYLLYVSLRAGMLSIPDPLLLAGLISMEQ